jgi:sulfide:quinone oxidoreductase
VAAAARVPPGAVTCPGMWRWSNDAPLVSGVDSGRGASPGAMSCVARAYCAAAGTRPAGVADGVRGIRSIGRADADGTATALADHPRMTGPTTPTRVLIAGAGIAGVEAALALRAFAGDAVRTRLIDPGRRFRIPATATGRAFGVGSVEDHPLADVAARAGATLTRGTVAAVDAPRHVVMLAGGRLLTYDALIVAVGAWAEPALPGALRFAGHADTEAIRSAVEDIAASVARGASPRLAIVIPSGCAWPLAAYELALMAHEHLTASGNVARIAIVTAEETPLAAFGPDAGAAVERMLGRSGIEVHTGREVEAWRWGRLELVGGGLLPADRVIAMPVLRGPAIEGLPADARGFVTTGDDGAVSGAPDVWAVGDGTAHPVKQGAVACRQADAVAATISRRLGIPAEELAYRPALRGWVYDTGRQRFVRAGRDASADGDDLPLGWPVAKVAGRFLTPFLQAWSADAPRASVPLARAG